MERSVRARARRPIRSWQHQTRFRWRPSTWGAAGGSRPKRLAPEMQEKRTCVLTILPHPAAGSHRRFPGSSTGGLGRDQAQDAGSSCTDPQVLSRLLGRTYSMNEGDQTAALVKPDAGAGSLRVGIDLFARPSSCRPPRLRFGRSSPVPPARPRARPRARTRLGTCASLRPGGSRGCCLGLRSLHRHELLLRRKLSTFGNDVHHHLGDDSLVDVIGTLNRPIRLIGSRSIFRRSTRTLRVRHSSSAITVGVTEPNSAPVGPAFTSNRSTVLPRVARSRSPGRRCGPRASHALRRSDAPRPRDPRSPPRPAGVAGGSCAHSRA